MDDHEASLAFSQTVVGQARRGRVTIDTEGENPVVAAMREHSQAVASGSGGDIKAARQLEPPCRTPCHTAT